MVFLFRRGMHGQRLRVQRFRVQGPEVQGSPKTSAKEIINGER
jgi:hypothetical protein